MLRFEVRVKYPQFCLIAIDYGTPRSSADFYSKIELQFKGEQIFTIYFKWYFRDPSQENRPTCCVTFIHDIVFKKNSW